MAFRHNTHNRLVGFLFISVPYQLKIATKLARDNFTGRFTMTMKLYKRDVSPPARACVMACELFGLNIEIIEIDELKKEHLTPEYLRLNPVHTVPVLIDGDVVVHDSHAILMYLADVYGKDDSLYPKDPKKRALVNQKLFFEAANLFSLMRKTIYRFIDYGETKLTQKQKDEFADTYSFLQEFLSRTDYIAGNNMTIADVSAITSVTALSYIVPIDSEKYPKIGPWMRKMEGKPFYKCNENGSKSLGQWLQRTFEL